MQALTSKNQTSNSTFYDTLLGALAELDCPAYVEELALYLRARHGTVHRTLTPTRIERMVESNLRRHRAEGTALPEPALCTALTAEHGEPIMKLVARTDWSVERRMMAATTGRVRHLLLTARLCELAITEKGHFADAHALLYLAATHARGLPDTVVRYKKYDLEEWLGLALGLIRATSREDEEVRASAAARLLRLPDFHPIFGVPDGCLGVRGV